MYRLQNATSEKRRHGRSATISVPSAYGKRGEEEQRAYWFDGSHGVDGIEEEEEEEEDEEEEEEEEEGNRRDSKKPEEYREKERQPDEAKRDRERRRCVGVHRDLLMKCEAGLIYRMGNG
jgi:FtsZ-interacting cell division protein YlmF